MAPRGDERSYLAHHSALVGPVTGWLAYGLAGGLVAFVLWDAFIDPASVVRTAPIRAAGALVIVAAAIWFGRGPATPGRFRAFGWISALTGMVVVTVAVALVDGGFVWGLAGLATVAVGTGWTPPRARDAVLLTTAGAAASAAIMLAGGIGLRELVNALVFLGLAVFAVAIIARMLESSFRRGFRLERDMERLARTDPLTGLPNRRRLEEALGDEWVRAARFGHPLALLLVDLDHFKDVNDRMGHGAGDAVLRELAERAAAGLRTTDTLGRLGGEEFVAMLPETSADGAVALAERLRREVAARPFGTPAGPVPITVSVGVAARRPGMEGWPALMLEADHAMYRAKRAGRDRVMLPE